MKRLYTSAEQELKFQGVNLLLSIADPYDMEDSDSEQARRLSHEEDESDLIDDHEAMRPDGLGTIHILRKHFYSPILNLITKFFIKN